MTIPIVDDDAKISGYVRQGVTEAGFMVNLARNGLGGHHLAMPGSYDMVILDVLLPDIDGWRIVQALRKVSAARDG